MDTSEVLDDALDTSWLTEEEQYLDEANYKVKCLEQVLVYFVYFNKEGNSIHNETKTLFLDTPPEETFSKLDKTIFTKLIDEQKRPQYQLFDIQVFHLPLVEENAQRFSASIPDVKTSQQYLKPAKLDNDIVFEPTVALFHELSAL